MIPTKEQILVKALEMWRNDQYRQGCEALADLTPEFSELSESGYISASKSELMRDTFKNTSEEWKSYNENVESSDDLKFDLEEAMKSGVLISGTTGTGKTDLAMYLTDRLMKQGITTLIFDSSQDWQARSSVPLYQTLTIPHIDTVPENSVIFDISRLSVQGRQNLIEHFSETLYRHQAMNPSRKQYFLVFEEGSSYFREGFMRGKRFSNTSMLMSEGRNYGVRFMVITQFFASIDKMAMRYMKQRYFGSTNEPRDVEYITRFFSREQKQEIGKTLRSLDAGSFLYMNGSSTERIHIQPYQDTVQKQDITIPKLETWPNKEFHSRKSDTTLAIARLILMAIFCAIIAGSLRF